MNVGDKYTAHIFNPTNEKIEEITFEIISIKEGIIISEQVTI